MSVPVNTLKALLVTLATPLGALFGGTLLLAGVGQGTGGSTAVEIVKIVEAVGENWRGLALIAAICIGPLFWVVRAQMYMQEKESAANRDAIRELARSQERIANKIEMAHQATNQAIVKELREVALALARFEGGRRQ